MASRARSVGMFEWMMPWRSPRVGVAAKASTKLSTVQSMARSPMEWMLTWRPASW